MIQNKNDSINSILQHAADNNCCVVFPTSRFPYLILYPRWCKLKVATTYLAIRTKNNENVFKYESLLLLKPPQITRSNIIRRTLRSRRINTNYNFITYQEHF